MITKDEWVAKGRELFGHNQEEWRFTCPQCGNEESAAKVRAERRAELPKLRAGKYMIEAECIGRHLDGVGRDWAAYGLLRGPVIVTDAGLEFAVFDFAGRPFTGGAGMSHG